MHHPSAARVAILGAGSWGTALATLLPGCARVTLWTRGPEHAGAINRDGGNAAYLPDVRLSGNTRATADLAEALDRADCVVFAIPSGGMREVAQAAAPHIPAGALLVNASKGLEDATGARMSEVIRQALGPSAEERLCVLSGPNLAVEVARGVPTASVAASTCASTAEACQGLWMGPTFRVYTCADPVGVELAGAMKNVVAIGAGVASGMGYGDNSRAALMTRGLAEITRLGVALSAQPATFLGLAGVGDLIATAGSRLSRNYRVGLGLGEGRELAATLDEIGQVAEGVPTTRAICLLAARVGVEMPIARVLHGLLFEGWPLEHALRSLMDRPARGEAEF